MEQPLLSIAMIVKNEIRCIEKCMKALQPLREAIPCQLVIADTGSTDGTREIAEKYADLLFDFEWVNDFSAARNAVLDLCKGKWVLNVDCDEYLDPSFSELAAFLTGSEANKFNWACVHLINYSDRGMKEEGIDFLATRMARMSAHPRYVNPVHECLSFPHAGPLRVLANVTFHHDGYAPDPRHPEWAIKKKKRNLALLEDELKKDPQNLRILMQCQESASQFPALLIDYCHRAMETLSVNYKTREGKMWGPVIVCHAVETAVMQRMPELEEWRTIAETIYPDAMSTRLDTTYALIQYYVREREHEKTVALTDRFLSAWKDFRDQKFDITILTHAIFRRTPRKFEVRARAAGCEALARLGRTGEAAELLTQEPDWDGLKPAELRTLLVAGTWAAGERSLQKFAARGAEIIRAMTGEEAAGMWDAFRAAANAAFQKRDPEEDAPERPWRLFAKVRGGLGQAVRLMEGKLPEIQAVLPQIKAEDWEDVPAPAAVRAVELGAELPAAFFTQSRERLAELAGDVSGAMTADDLLDWTDRRDFTPSMTRFQFLFHLLSAALRADKTWEEETAGREALLDRFLDVAADYLPNCYNPELLADETEWTALPGLHRFALHLLQGRAAQAAGDVLGYIRALRAALKAAPAMKKAISFLMASAAPGPSPSQDPELLALAKQVKTLLSQFPADDPAKAGLKESPAYRKVARLLEPEEPGAGVRR